MCFFFFKQKTAYEMRISDWSSDVCSSDLVIAAERAVYLGAAVTERIERDAETRLPIVARIIIDVARDVLVLEPVVACADLEREPIVEQRPAILDIIGLVLTLEDTAVAIGSLDRVIGTCLHTTSVPHTTPPPTTGQTAWRV